MKTVPLILVSIVLAITGQMLLKMGMIRVGEVKLSQIGSFLVKVISTPEVTGGFLIYALSALLWLVVLSRVNLSYAYPFLGITLGAVLILSNFLLHEDIPSTRWVGVIVIILGVVISSR